MTHGECCITYAQMCHVLFEGPLMTSMAEFPLFFIKQKIHIIVMEDVDPDCKEWQDHEKENAKLSIKGFADLIDESEVIQVSISSTFYSLHVHFPYESIFSA
jgi:hypothetical protein